MNLKLNADVAGSAKLLNKKPRTASAVKEERQRTGRYIAILVGICLFLLAIYHAWVRRIPVVASLVVPALIMFVYVAWVLYTASRDKHRLLDAEAARALASLSFEQDGSISEHSQPSETYAISPTENSRINCCDVNEVIKETKETRRLVRPIILINDKPPEDLELRISNVLEMMLSDKFKDFPTRRKFKRRFCRSRRCAVFKRSYSIA